MSTDYVQLNATGNHYISKKSEDWVPMAEPDTPPRHYVALKRKKKKEIKKNKILQLH